MPRVRAKEREGTEREVERERGGGPDRAFGDVDPPERGFDRGDEGRERSEGFEKADWGVEGRGGGRC